MYAITCYVYNSNLLKIKIKTLSSTCSKPELYCYMKMDKGLRPQHCWLIYNPITDEHTNSMLNEQWDQVVENHFSKGKLKKKTTSNAVKVNTGYTQRIISGLLHFFFH